MKHVVGILTFESVASQVSPCSAALIESKRTAYVNLAEADTTSHGWKDQATILIYPASLQILNAAPTESIYQHCYDLASGRPVARHCQT